MCTPVSHLNPQTFFLAAAAKDPKNAYDQLSKILKNITPDDPNRGKLESLKCKVALLAEFSDSLNQTSKMVEETAESAGLKSPKKKHIWNFQKEIPNERGGSLRIYTCKIDPMMEAPHSIAEVNALLQRFDDQEKYIADINHKLYPAVEPHPFSAIERLPCQNGITELFLNFVAITELKTILGEVAQLVHPSDDNTNTIELCLKRKYGNNEHELWNSIIDLSKGCKDSTQLTERIKDHFASLVSEAKESTRSKLNFSTPVLCLDDKEQQKNFHIITKNLGYKLKYVHTTKEIEITLPDQDAFEANWRYCREKFPDLPEFRLKSSKGIASHLSFVLAYLQSDGLLSDCEEFTHDHFAHIDPTIGMFFSRHSRSPLREQIDEHIHIKCEFREKIAECLVRLLWAKKNATCNSIEEFSILEYILGAFVDGASSKISCRRDIPMSFSDIAESDILTIPRLILNSTLWRCSLDSLYGKLDEDKINESWNRIMKEEIETLPNNDRDDSSSSCKII